MYAFQKRITIVIEKVLFVFYKVLIVLQTGMRQSINHQDVSAPTGTERGRLQEFLFFFFKLNDSLVWESFSSPMGMYCSPRRVEQKKAERKLFSKGH